MGCKCCKIIQSYIFEPQDVPIPGYINETNNYKSDSPDGGKLKCKRSAEIHVHKNKLQNSDSQLSENRNKLNNTKDAVRNHRNVHEEGLGNGLEKSNVIINGVPSYSDLKSNHNTNRNKEAGLHFSSVQLPDCPAKGLSQPKECNSTNLEAGHPKLPLVAAESCPDRQLSTAGGNGCLAQSDTLEAQSVWSPDPDFSKNATQQTVDGHESLSNNRSRAAQSTEWTFLNRHGDQALGVSQRSGSGDEPYRTETLNGCPRDQTFSDSPSPRPKPEAEEVCCGRINGEFEEEDADVAEALAALAAATAGEDFEE